MRAWFRNRRLRDRHIDALKVVPTPTASPETVASPTTIDSMDHAELAEQWAKHTQDSVLQCSAHKPIDYKAKAEQELASIQRKARQLELMMLKYHAEHGPLKDSPMLSMHEPSHIGEAVSVDTAAVQGGTVAETQTSPRFRSIPDAMNNAVRSTVHEAAYSNSRPPLHPRRTKSSGALGADTPIVPQRLPNGQYLNPDVPYQCVYCKRTFETLATAQKLHPVCTMWSCNFLLGIQYAIYPIESDGELKALCCYCNASLGQGQEGRVKSAVLKGHMRQHKFRSCEHKLYYCGQTFRQHLHDEHRSIYDGTLFAAWTLLFKSCQRSQPSLFEKAETLSAAQRSNTDPGFGGGKKSTAKKQLAVPSNFMELTETSAIEHNKLRRKRSAATLPDKKDNNFGSTHSLPRPSTMETTTSPSVPPIPQDLRDRLSPSITNAATVSSSLIGNMAGPRLAFYRRRIDASTRNQVYLHSLDEAMSVEYQQHFRKIPGNTLGGLILHSSLAATVPVRMTNSVDLYPLH